MNHYRVLAIFHGHTHSAALRRSIGKVPVLDSGASFVRTFMTAGLDLAANRFSVDLATGNVVDPVPLLTLPATTVRKPEFEMDLQANGHSIVAHIFMGDTRRDTLNGSRSG